jgi:hypothetical protein
MTIVETPAASRRSAFAALPTAGSASAYTAISSLGHSNRSTLLDDSNHAPPHRGRTARRTRTETGDSSQYDSDDDDTDDEAGYELNRTNGFWNIQTNEVLLREQMDTLDIGDEDDGNESLVSGSTPIGTSSLPPAVPDFGNLIAECNEFHFKEITTEEEAEDYMRLHPLPKLYDGETGLKRGVAASFNTPLEALRQAGMTPDLISRYTKNSNRYV